MNQMFNLIILYNWILIPLTVLTMTLFYLTYRKVGWLGFLFLSLGSLFYSILRIYVATYATILPGNLDICLIFAGEITRVYAAWYFFTTADKFFLIDDAPRDSSHDVENKEIREQVKEDVKQAKEDDKQAKEDAKEAAKN